jgi:hypothetical protein
MILKSQSIFQPHSKHPFPYFSSSRRLTLLKSSQTPSHLKGCPNRTTSRVDQREPPSYSNHSFEPGDILAARLKRGATFPWTPNSDGRDERVVETVEGVVGFGGKNLNGVVRLEFGDMCNLCITMNRR